MGLVAENGLTCLAKDWLFFSPQSLAYTGADALEQSIVQPMSTTPMPSLQRDDIRLYLELHEPAAAADERPPPLILAGAGP